MALCQGGQHTSIARQRHTVISKTADRELGVFFLKDIRKTGCASLSPPTLQFVNPIVSQILFAK